MRTIEVRLTPEDEERLARIRAYLERPVSDEVPGIDVSEEHTLLMGLRELADAVDRTEGRPPSYSALRPEA